MFFTISSLFAPYDVSKCEIKYQWVWEDYILRSQTLLDQFISKDTAKQG